MAIKYTLKQIELINQQNKGIKDRFYEDVDGFVYRGLANGRLFKYVKCSEVSIDDKDLKALGSTSCEVMVSLNDKIETNKTAISSNSTLIGSEIAEVKCFSIAMAVAL